MAEDSALYWSREEGNLANLINKADSMSENEIKQLGKKAKKRVAEEYTWERICKLYEQCFARINR